MTRFLFVAAAALATTACSSSDGGDATPGAGGVGAGGGAGGVPVGGEGGAGGDVGGANAGGAGGGGGACTGPAWPDNAACEACQTASCCINASNCAADAECVAIMQCVADGGSNCSSGHPDGIWWYSGLAICLQNQCASECGLAPAECGAIQPTPASCTDEIQAACCEETAACGESDACVAFIYQCIDQNECTAPACFNACLAMYPEAEAPFMAMADCWEGVPCL